MFSMMTFKVDHGILFLCDACVTGDTIDFTNPEVIELEISEKDIMGLTEENIMICSAESFSKVIKEIFIVDVT